jgi:hypothetical protein
MRARVLALAAALVGLLAGPASALEPPALEQGGAWFGRLEPGARVILEGRSVRVGPHGEFVVGFGRDHAPAAEMVVVHADGVRETVSLSIAQREYEIQRIDGLPESQVTPPAEVLARIREEHAAITAVRVADTPHPWFADPEWSPEPEPIWPAEGVISGVYGSQRILNGKPRQPHFGVDIANDRGTRVTAPLGGRVVFIRDMYFSGLTMVIDHGHGLTSSFLHLSVTRVETGDMVRQGQDIAAIGASGRVTGPHLDWRMNWFDERIDPALLAGPFSPAQD